MEFFDWVALTIGAGLVMSGTRAVLLRKAATPELHGGARAVGLGLVWTGLGVLFIMAVLFDIPSLKILSRCFLESAN